MGEAITIEKLAKDGKSMYQRGEYLEAARLFEAARQAYLASDDALNAGEMANNVSVAFLQAENAEEALKAVEGIAPLFAEAGDLRREGMTLGNMAAALDALGRDEEAAEVYLQSANILGQAGEDQLRANVMQSLSMLQFRSGRQLQALASFNDGLDGVKKPTPKQTFLKKLLRIPLDMLAPKKPS